MHKVTLIPGDGIGPEVAFAAKEVVDSSGAHIDWDIINAGESTYEETGEFIPQKLIDNIYQNKIVLKGPITTPIGKGFRSINVNLRQEFDTYSNIRPVKSLPGTKGRFENVDLIVFRENTEGLYRGIEHRIDRDGAEAIRIITRKNSMRIIERAFEYARANARKKVTAVHKANILKITDGLFLECGRKVAENYPDIEYEEKIVDNMCMQLVMYPEEYDVLVMPNLYGDILSDLASGLVGGLGLVPGANIGDNIGIFEAVHGSAPDIAGKNIANPIACILSSAMMLDHMGERDAAAKIRKAIYLVLEEGKYKTIDLGGNSSTEEITKAICDKL